MGFQNKRVIKHEGFEPLELNEGNVQAVFIRCLATEKSTEVIARSVLSKQFGFEEDSMAISFDKETINKNYNTIKYLFGQIASIHEGSLILTPQRMIKSYQGTIWCTNDALISMLIHLGIATIDETTKRTLITPWLKASDDSAVGADLISKNFSISATVLDIKPSLSPKDPNFPAWYETHKAEWEARKQE